MVSGIGLRNGDRSERQGGNVAMRTFFIVRSLDQIGGSSARFGTPTFFNVSEPKRIPCRMPPPPPPSLPKSRRPTGRPAIQRTRSVFFLGDVIHRVPMPEGASMNAPVRIDSNWHKPGRLWSLLDMLKVNAIGFARTAACFADLRQMFGHLSATSDLPLRGRLETL